MRRTLLINHLILFVSVLALSGCAEAFSVEPIATNTPLPPVVTDTPAPPTNTATPAPPTNTPTPTTVLPTSTPTLVPPTETPTPTPTPETLQAEVNADALNVRSGPGTNYSVITVIRQGEFYVITGRNEGSTWLQLCCFDGQPGWASAQFFTTSGDVTEAPVPQNLPTPAPTPTPAPSVAQASGRLLYSVFSADVGRWELWEHNFANSESKFLKEWRTEVAFSPDFSQVVYYTWPAAAGSKYGIYIANADLSGEWLVIIGGAYPSFSPGGDRLVLNGGDTMFTLNTDQSGLREIDKGEYPAWSPVDNWIAHRGCYGGDCGLWLTHADSGERRRLTTGGSDGQPAWSPDGSRVAYISQDDGNFEIYRIDRDGSNKVRLTDDIHSDGLPVWSPDGKWIAFRSDRGGSWAVYLMRTDGSQVQKLVDADVLPLWFCEKMAWRP